VIATLSVLISAGYIVQELAEYERISDDVKVTAERKFMSVLCILSVTSYLGGMAVWCSG